MGWEAKCGSVRGFSQEKVVASIGEFCQCSDEGDSARAKEDHVHLDQDLGGEVSEGQRLGLVGYEDALIGRALG